MRDHIYFCRTSKLLTNYIKQIHTVFEVIPFWLHIFSCVEWLTFDFYIKVFSVFSKLGQIFSDISLLILCILYSVIVLSTFMCTIYVFCIFCNNLFCCFVYGTIFRVIIKHKRSLVFLPCIFINCNEF